MSFDFTLSSSEDEDDEPNEKLASPLFVGKESDNRAASTSVARRFSPTNEGIPPTNVATVNSASDARKVEASISSSDDDDSLQGINWEDVDGEEEEFVNDDRKPPAIHRPVTIDLSSKPNDSKEPSTKRRRISRRVYSFRSLPNDIKTLLLNIHRSHLLTLTSRVMHLSQCSSDTALLHVAHSILSAQHEVLTSSRERVIPTEEQLREFCTWYFDLVNQAEQRRQRRVATNVRAGAPARRIHRNHSRKSSSGNSNHAQYHGEGRTRPTHLVALCRYLPTTFDENPQLVEDDSVNPTMSQNDKAQLLVALIRSMGWRARLVVALDPIKCDLDIDHPLFINGFKDVFQTILQTGHTSNGSASKQHAAKPRKKAHRSDTDASALSSASVGSFSVLMWTEILCQRTVSSSKDQRSHKSPFRWMHVDPGKELINQPKTVESLLARLQSDQGTQKKKEVISYALAVEHSTREDSVAEGSRDNGMENSYRVRLTDVTPRYASAWSQTLKKRGQNTVVHSYSQQLGSSRKTWWQQTITQANYHFNKKTNGEATTVGGDGSAHQHGNPDDAADSAEQAELLESAATEAMPTSKKAFNNHPLYAIPSLMNRNEVLAPGSKKRVCGVFKGELVYKRSDVSTARTPNKWLYKGRRVMSKEMGTPVKRVKARKSGATKGFKALKSYGVGSSNDGSEQARLQEVKQASIPLEEYDNMDELYGIWQTRPWSPPRIGPNDMIPVNEHKNVDIALLNPGLVHLVEPRMSVVAKRLQVPYAPALLGFEGHGGNRVPTIKGIVVHEHNVELLQEAYAEFQSEALESEIGKNQQQVYRRWKKLIVGILTKDRLEREYGKEHS